MILLSYLSSMASACHINGDSAYLKGITHQANLLLGQPSSCSW